MAALEFIIAPILSGLLANGLVHAFKQISEWREARKKLHAADKEEFQAALASESLRSLGSYLDKSLGPFLVTEYANNAEVKSRVDLFLARLQEYVGSSGEVKPEPEPAPPTAPKSGSSAANDELSVVEEKLAEATPWDALATLRRMIEVHLSDLAKQHNIQLPKRSGAGRMLEVLRRNQIVPDGLARSLRYAIEVANGAIHGFDVSIYEAHEAIRQARFALSELGLLRQGQR
jgi:hypothetical protein